MKKSELKSIKKGVIRLIKAVRDSVEDCPYPYLPDDCEIKQDENGNFYAVLQGTVGWRYPSRQAAVTSAWATVANVRKREINGLKTKLNDRDLKNEKLPIPDGYAIVEKDCMFQFVENSTGRFGELCSGKTLAVVLAWMHYSLELDADLKEKELSLSQMNKIVQNQDQATSDLREKTYFSDLPSGFVMEQQQDGDYRATIKSETIGSLPTKQAVIAFVWAFYAHSLEREKAKLNLTIADLRADLRKAVTDSDTPFNQAVRDVLADCKKHAEDGWTPEKFDTATKGQLVYEALRLVERYSMTSITCSRKDIVRAASLLVEEIKRLDRLNAKEKQ